MSIDSGKHIRRGHTVTFGLLLLFGVFELALTSWLTARFATHHDAISSTETNRVHFVLFCSGWTLLGSLIYGLLFWHGDKGALVGIASHLGFLVPTWILWTSAGAAITEMLGGGLNCKTQKQFTYCTQMNAVEAFAWIEWLLITFALIVVLYQGFGNARRGDGWHGSLV
ncbi:hypothetical protein C8J56DRAFT_916879 [Mycena floridula]|nr:hypothetical protein C8J56DRAFT_916879 [Mycena floridula]